SSIGQVRRLPSIINYRIDGRTKKWPGRIMKQKTDVFGYKNVCLCKKGKKESLRIHTLVIKTFKGPRTKGMEASHLDGNKANNESKNLEWMTHKDNEALKIKHGTVATGDRNGNSRKNRLLRAKNKKQHAIK
ncbi:HNH endonuclease, partial [Candidatus Pacearchaeota archaeon]|nr:HNH endonuclease [Candidatus Pacearchaeota archaeon]